ncbi:MAG: A24 family peptidase [Selenomonadaceae bacterium]|nr:A24 family peptidase [Selenomonadaceae bacterium]
MSAALRELALGAPLALLGIWLSAMDIRQGILPNRLVLALGCSAVLLAPLRGMGSWDAGCGFLVGGGLLWLLRAVSGGMGGGDVKLGAALGLWLGGEGTLLMLFLAFLFGGIAAAGILLLHRGGWKSSLAFGPFLFVSAWLVYLDAPTMEAWFLWGGG